MIERLIPSDNTECVLLAHRSRRHGDGIPHKPLPRAASGCLCSLKLVKHTQIYSPDRGDSHSQRCFHESCRTPEFTASNISLFYS